MDRHTVSQDMAKGADTEKRRRAKAKRSKAFAKSQADREVARKARKAAQDAKNKPKRTAAKKIAKSVAQVAKRNPYAAAAAVGGAVIARKLKKKGDAKISAARKKIEGKGAPIRKAKKKK